MISNKKYYFWTFILYRYPHWHIMPYKTLNQIKIGPQIYQITNKISKMKDQAFITERPFKCEGYFIPLFSKVMWVEACSQQHQVLSFKEPSQYVEVFSLFKQLHIHRSNDKNLGP